MDESDKKYIDDNVKGNPEPLPWENKPMIRYQWSDKRDNEIFVVETTGEPLETFIEKVTDMKNQYGLGDTQIPPRFVPAPAVSTAAFTSPPPPNFAQPSVICDTCGAKAFINSGVSKVGKPYTIKKCSASPELKIKGGHSFWM